MPGGSEEIDESLDQDKEFPDRGLNLDRKVWYEVIRGEY
jgi:hypothetical protein